MVEHGGSLPIINQRPEHRDYFARGPSKSGSDDRVTLGTKYFGALSRCGDFCGDPRPTSVLLSSIRASAIGVEVIGGTGVRRIPRAAAIKSR